MISILRRLISVGLIIKTPSLTIAEVEDHRTNFCYLQSKVENGVFPMKDALKGMNISAAVGSEINAENPYIAVRMLNELARRGGFNINYHVTGYPSANESWTDVLLKNTNNNDLACDWWERRVSRLDLGIVYPEGWYDADVIMIRKPPPTEDTFSFWAFSKPFSPGLWILIFNVIVLTGIVYYYLDYLKSRASKEDMDTNFLGSIFFSFHAFTGHYNYQAKSRPSIQILSTSMCFLYLILISAYTANLANFFIAKNRPSIVIHDIGDVFTNNQRLCVLHGYPSTVLIEKQYPNANLIKKRENDEVFIAVSDGECDVGLTSVEQWKTLTRDKRYNKGCDLEWVGRRVDSVQAGFALKDSQEHCTSLFNNALNLLLIQMKAEGAVEGVWRSHRDATTTPSCLAPTVVEEAEGDEQLTVKNMGGVFAFHACLLLVAVGLGLYEFYHQPAEFRKEMKAEIRTSISKVSSNFKSLRNLSATSEMNENLPIEHTSRSLNISRKYLSRNNSSLEGLEAKDDEFSSEENDPKNELILHNQLFFSHKLERIMSTVERFQTQQDTHMSEMKRLKEKMKKMQEIIDSKFNKSDKTLESPNSNRATDERWSCEPPLDSPRKKTSARSMFLPV